MLMDKFKKDIEMSGLKTYTRLHYISEVSAFLKYVDKSEDEITLQDVQDFLHYLRYEKKLAIGTVNNYRAGIKFLFEVTLDKGWNDRKIPRIRGYKPLPSVLDKTEVISLIDHVPDIMYKAILNTVYSSGMRVGEVVSLKVKDIDSKRMQIYISAAKNGNARYTILSEKNLMLLRNYIREYRAKTGYPFTLEDYLFPSPRTKNSQKHITSRCIEYAIQDAAIKAGITKKVTVHTLRHSFATHLLEAGQNIFYIKQLLGHSSISSTCIYLHLMDISQMGIKSPLDMEV